MPGNLCLGLSLTWGQLRHQWRQLQLLLLLHHHPWSDYASCERESLLEQSSC